LAWQQFAFSSSTIPERLPSLVCFEQGTEERLRSEMEREQAAAEGERQARVKAVLARVEADDQVR